MHFLPAWKRALQQSGAKDWHFVVAGPDEGGHRVEVEALVSSLELGSSVSFVGLLQGEEKRAALGAASAFVLPSHSEGFSMSLLEAMGAHLPLLITPHCNFPEAVQVGAALSIEATEESSVQGLDSLFSLSALQLQTMGDCGRSLVEQDYTWESAAQKMESVYLWCCGQSSKPNCVIE
ncbi:MAG: glycosyltransferase [Proteobacteria bacterium]|nr:MAG: glycosyltransferase [Pseudomonadota bacterium]